MESLYREVAAPPRLAAAVECFWTRRVGVPENGHRVLPDGCVDILFSRRSSGAADLRVVGTMTRAHRFDLAEGDEFFGVRFRPGMAHPFLRIPLKEVTDRSIALDEVAVAGARVLRDRLDNAATDDERIVTVSAFLSADAPAGPVHRIAESFAAGSPPLDEIVAAAGVSARQLRRIFLEQVGVSPKTLARILRFRRAAAHARSFQGRLADLALDCGYYDQSHFANEFREFAGTTPGRLGAPR